MGFEFWQGLLQIIFFDLILSGDNAVVIALAARSLPEKQQKQAIIWGSVGAVALRVILTFIALWLLGIPFLKFIGGVLLLWIAYKLMTQKKEHEGNVKEAGSFFEAIRTIIIADFVMSLDNVLAIVGVAHGNVWLVAFGLLFSIPLIFWGSRVLLLLIRRFPIIVYAGAGLLAWTAGDMMMTDRVVASYLERFPVFVEWAIPLTITVLTLAVGWWLHQRPFSVREKGS